MTPKTAFFASRTIRNMSLQGTCNLGQRHFLKVKTLSPLEVRVINAKTKVETARERLGSWRAVGDWLGHTNKATACNRLVKHADFRPSIELVEMIEAATLPPLIRHVEACPDCGSAHTGRCHGKPVAQVVILTDNERVVSRGKPRNRKRYHRPCMDDETYAEYLQWRCNFDRARHAVDGATADGCDPGRA